MGRGKEGSGLKQEWQKAGESCSHSLVQHSGSILSLRWWFPEDDTVFTGLGEGQLPKPADTVYIVTVDVSC